jgi:hypothetical protein
MKQANFSKKSKSASDVVTQKKQQPKAGPVELDLAELKKVSGGLPRGGWAVDTTKKTV